MFKLIVSFNILFLSIWAFFNPQQTEKTHSDSEIPMCRSSFKGDVKPFASAVFMPQYPSVSTNTVGFDTDSTKAYTMPLLTSTPKGEILLSWTEKDEQGMTAFCLSFSKDNGKTFSDKKVIYAGLGVGNSRLMRAKVLAKKDGSLVAVFSNRTVSPNAQPQGGGRGGRGGGRASEIVYCTSKDGGTNWTSPQAVDTDTTKGLLRGFFDAVVLPNDEIAVAYLKDVKGSTKHEERDLRLAITKNGVFQAEKLLDPVVCDCCNINLLVDANGHLNVFYRDNNDDIRDISKMVSTDNGQTFSKPQIVHNDGWKIMGCPHSGAISSIIGKGALVAWYSGTETESGVRLVTNEGKKLFVLEAPSVKNPTLLTSNNLAALVWEQKQNNSDKTELVFRKIQNEKASETMALEGSAEATNPTGLLLGNQMLIAYEVKKENKKNSLKIMTTGL